MAPQLTVLIALAGAWTLAPSQQVRQVGGLIHLLISLLRRMCKAQLKFSKKIFFNEEKGLER